MARRGFGGAASPPWRFALNAVEGRTVQGGALAGVIARFLIQEEFVAAAMCANGWGAPRLLADAAKTASGVQVTGRDIFLMRELSVPPPASRRIRVARSSAWTQPLVTDSAH